jgi:hypothetical protein
MKGSPIKRNFGVGSKVLSRGGSLFKFTYKDLEKKSGFGPIEIKEDDQSKRAARARYEMGVYNVDPTKKPTKPPVITDMEDYKQREKLYNITEKPRN